MVDPAVTSSSLAFTSVVKDNVVYIIGYVVGGIGVLFALLWGLNWLPKATKHVTLEVSDEERESKDDWLFARNMYNSHHGD